MYDARSDRTRTRLGKGRRLFNSFSSVQYIAQRAIYLSTSAMALNWTMLKHDRSPIPLPNEQTITSIETGTDLSLTIPDVPPTTSSSTAGGSGGAKKLKAFGKIWLTDQRVCGSIIPLRFRYSLDLSWPRCTHPTADLYNGNWSIFGIALSSITLYSLYAIRATDLWGKLPSIRNQAIARGRSHGWNEGRIAFQRQSHVRLCQSVGENERESYLYEKTGSRGL